MCTVCHKNPCAGLCPNAENKPAAICPSCKDKLYPGYDAYLFEGKLFNSKNCVDIEILKNSSEIDFRAYCRSKKEDFFDFIDIDAIFDEDKPAVSFYDAINGVSDFKKFALFDLLEYGEWYRAENGVDIEYAVIRS